MFKRKLSVFEKRCKNARSFLEKFQEMKKDPMRDTLMRKLKRFFRSYSEIVNYFHNLDKHKKYLFVYNGIQKEHDAILECSIFAMETKALSSNYDFISTRVIDCSTCGYNDMDDIAFEKTETDKLEIKTLLRNYLKDLVSVNRGYPRLIGKMRYNKEKDGNTIMGYFTPKADYICKDMDKTSDPGIQTKTQGSSAHSLCSTQRK